MQNFAPRSGISIL